MDCLLVTVKNLNIDWSLFCSFILAITAIASCRAATKQTKISNKQFLFEKRLTNYKSIKELFSLYSKHKNLLRSWVIEPKDFSVVANVSIDFTFLTNSGRWESMVNVFKNYKDIDSKRTYLLKKEEFRDFILENSFLWTFKGSKVIVDFLDSYLSLLDSLYKIEVYYQSLKENNENSIGKLSPEDFSKYILNCIEKTNINQIVENLEKLYIEIKENDLISKMEKEISLK